tara:strand:- start:25790 stop:27700 length:1911 start_codon:yes stop_codon:yes gene_type:complete
MRKKKLLFQSDYALAKTGFGRNAKAVLSYLYDTGKYDIVHYCCGIPWSSPQLQRTPWKGYGTLPDSEQEQKELGRDPHVGRLASYGAHNLDKVIQEVKPDVYIAVQDIWGIDFAVEKKWFKHVASALWTTLDSLPILPAAVQVAPKVDNYWIWSDFATKALNEMGHEHIKTLHGAVDGENFYKLPSQIKKQLRQKFGITEDTFIVGFVFRNQLRKSVPNLIEGFKKFQNNNPNSNSKLLLHTHFGEGWNIMKLADEYKVSHQDIITTYVCRKCWNYAVQHFHGLNTQCGHCGAKDSCTTTNVSEGVSEEQLNEVYNLMDVYCHPFTSGGQEIPIQEAKLTELITLVTDYSCGEEMCQDGAESLPLAWSEYREHGTEFIKASTSPLSISKQLGKVFKMKPDKRQKMGKQARKWAIDNFSPAHVGGFIEKFIDEAPFTEYDFSLEEVKKNPQAEIPEIEDDSEWIKALYHNILMRPEVDEKDDGHRYWMHEIARGMSRPDIEKYFRQVAQKENAENEKVEFTKFLDEDDEGKRMIYVMPDGPRDVFLSTSIFKSLKNQYPDYNLYVSTKQENAEILDGNEHIHKVVPYVPQMEDWAWLEGNAEHKGFFEIALLPFGRTQRFIDYLHNGKDNITYELNL